MIDQIKHIFECGKCRHTFVATPNYNDDPKTRDCPECKQAKGNILYHGTSQRTFNVIRDDLGLHGVKNHVDGKHYDSKSELRKSYKQHGVVEVGNEPIPTKKSEIKGDFDCRREVAQAIDRTGLMEQLKRGRK